MKFNVVNRLMLLNLLPNVGDIKSLKIMRVCKEELSFSEEEQKALKFINQPGGAVKWDEKGEGDPKEIEIGDVLNRIIVELLKDLDKAKKLTDSNIELWDLFMEGGDDADSKS